LLAVALAASPASAQLAISQLFGGATTSTAGNPAAPNGDFVEIFNRSCVAVNLDAYTVQISGGSSSTWTVIQLPNFQLEPGAYYCIRLTDTTPQGTPFTADQTFIADILTSSSGKAAIVLGTTALTGNACPPLASVVDFAKYYATVPPLPADTCTEGLPFGVSLGGSTAGRSVSRRPDVNGDGQGDGCQDTNVNNNDFMSDIDAAVPRTNNGGVTNVCPGAVVFGGCNLETGECNVTAGAAACAALGGTYLGDCTPCIPPQACCLPTTPVSCQVQSEVECQLNGGVFNPGSFSCPPAAGCGVLGRCCASDGNCVVTFEVLCVSPNVYGGDGTNCNGTPCQGRCCDLNGSCFVAGPDQCIAPNVFGGLGTDCSQPETCQGRCCAQDGTCTLTGAANCFAPSTFGGVGSNCQNQRTYGNPNPPTVDIPTGAPGTTAGPSVPSIITVGDNFNIQDVDVVIKIQHTYRGDINICLTGPDGTVVQLTVGTCTGGGTCVTEDNFNVRFNDEGLAVNCADPNLANLAATPVDVIPAASLAVFDGLPSAGQWTLNINDDVGGDVGVLQDWAILLDDGNACMGACCRTNGSCFISGELPCQQQGGTFQGAGVSCSPSPCAPNGACCIGGICSQQSNIDCLANNGVFGGAGTSCDTPPCFVPCCKSDGTCTLLTAAACSALPFSTAGAPGTPCPSEPCAPVGACCSEGDICVAPVVQAACAAPSTWLAGIGCQLSYVTNTDCAPNFVDISTTGTELTGFVGLDDSAVTVNLPFTFRYYGVDQTIASVGINGYVVFGGGSAAGIPGNSPLNGAGFVDNSIYVYGDDLHLRALSEGKIFVQQLGTSPDSLFIIQWTNMDLFTPSQPNGQRNTFQVKLYEASGVVEMQYLSLNLTGQSPLPADVVIGTRETAANVTEVSQSVVGVGPAAIIFAPTGGCTAITQPTGSCCITGQPCSVQTQAQCQLLCGTYLGNNTNCSTTPCANEACCLPQGGCVDVVAVACATLNGVAQGPGTNCGTANCPPSGKCCSPTGSCTVNLQASCQEPGSTWEAGADCSSPCLAGACCAPDGSCSQTAIGACLAPSAFRGGLSCGQSGVCDGRCCGAGGSCTVTSGSAGCNGTFSIGQNCSNVTVLTYPVSLLMQDPDAGGTPVSDVQTVTGFTGNITDLDVDLLIDHTFVGDVLIQVEHMGTVVAIYDRPGVPATQFGCGSADADVILDDEGTADIETTCNAVAPSALSPPNFIPNNSLAAFDGMDPNGEWTLIAADVEPVAADIGTVLRWSLHISVAGDVCSGGGCACRGDLNADTVVNGKDVNLFAQCVASGGAGCPCGDMNNSGAADSADVAAFVTAVVTGNCGP